MSLADFIITLFCWIDDQLPCVTGGQRLRQRGFMPKLSDSEVITLEVVGETLGLDTDKHIWAYFRRHWADWFPGLGTRTTFVRQAAALWAVKERLHRRLVETLGACTDPIHLVDGFPLPVCVITRAPRCRVFAETADHGYCAAKQTYYYGLHGHMMISYDGIVTGLSITPASGSEREALWDLTPGIRGLLIGDKGYLSAWLQAELATVGIDLQTERRANMVETRDPAILRWLKTMRRRIETVIGQLAGRFHIERVWARDPWHLTSRLLRKILAHTLCIFMNRQLGRPDLQFDGLIAA